MTKKEAAIVSAYTGIMLGSFSELHKYSEKILCRPIFTHEFGNEKVAIEIKEKSAPDFIKLIVEG